MVATNILSAPSLVNIEEVAPFSETDLPLFDELYQVLKKHNALTRFGVNLLHQHFDIADNEVLLESTDRESRVQTIEPVDKSELLGITYIETSWRLDTGTPMMACFCKMENTSQPPQHVHRSK